MTVPRLYLGTSPTLGAFQPDAGHQRSRWKEVLRTGQYVHPVHGWKLPVDQDRLSGMATTLRQMLSNGVTSDVTVDHSQSAKDKFGTIGDVKVEGQSLYLRHDFADDQGLEMANRVGEVSIEIEPELADGHGRTYKDAIVASSIVRQPVVPGQGPFLKIAASRGQQPGAEGGIAAGLPFILSVNAVTDKPGTKNPAQPAGSNQTMDLTLNKDQLTTALKHTGLGEDASAEDLVTKLIDLAGKGVEVGDLEKKAASLETEKAELSRQVTKLTPTKPNPEVEQMRAELISTEREAIEDGVGELVTLSLITPAQKGKLTEALAGTAKTPAKFMLSRGEGGAKSPARQLLNDIREILTDPAAVKLRQQKTGPQVMELSRQVPGENSDDDNVLVQDAEARAKA